MKRTMFALFAAAAMISPVAAADMESSRSVGAHPVVYDDYPESDVVMDVGPDVVITITGEARTRFEWIENTTDFSEDGADSHFDNEEFDDSMSYMPARFNLGLRADLPRDVAAVIELQSNFDFGGGDSLNSRVHTTQYQRPGLLNGDHHPGLGGRVVGAANDPHPFDLQSVRNSLESSDGVFVYQGYLETAHIGDSIFSLRFGRQELAYGTEWLLGNQDFYDGQSFDGIKGIFEFSDNHRLDLFWAKLAERQTSGDDQGEIDLYGAYFSAQSLGGSTLGLDAYLIGLNDDSNASFDVTAFDTTVPSDGGADVVSGGVGPTGDAVSFMEAWWAGARLFREREHGFHFSAEVTYLFGSIEGLLERDPAHLGPEDDEFDLSSWGAEVWAGFTFDTPSNPTIRGNFTFAQGTDAGDLADGDYHTFFTPAGEIHPRLGLMDIVDASNVWAGMIGYTGSMGCHSWGVDLWHFELDEVDPFEESFFIAGSQLGDDHSFDEELGQEVDLWYNYQYSEHMVAQFAVSWFNAGDFIEERNDCLDNPGTCHTDANHTTTDIDTDDAWRVYANLLVRF